ncbi:hypothetical protein A1O7_01813 [Cladophialophora yegresii CBS 114405]|uniref:Xylanolytic transcriptional activator regulatory domain-containing protein n=1 Tax=Cladophialophora yegresii CBS 114405 TaxID=1182544 RepID=W9WBI3_9EURO|nr:uncharacterized protein A1O7_01813 [Cladophialophora yegresii CBS 114405]EXJ65472.1 hypothetical protein A1O7_01813 [Cladophialophora yegresii CBS 114405]
MAPRCYCSGASCTNRWRSNTTAKTQIEQLQARITQLEAALEQSRAQNGAPLPASQDLPPAAISNNTPTPLFTGPQNNNIISRLCQRQWQLNSDAEGQYKFFRPTSSLHLTESVSLSVLGAWEESPVTDDALTIDDIDDETQSHLLDLYWHYQHTSLQIFHKQTFLNARAARHPKYVSKTLLYCIFACGARVSPRPAIKAMVLPEGDDDLDDNQPHLIAMITKHMEEELKRPRITTIQALLLLSFIYCALGQDTKGWLLTGHACMLAIDLGIHKNLVTPTGAPAPSPEELVTRQLTYWGCMMFDRFWALYLGRPACLKADGSSLDCAPWVELEDPWEARMARAWATLVKTTGDICEALNSEGCTLERLEQLDGQLQSWHDNLDESNRYRKDTSPSVVTMHLQYAAGKILLHQPNAKFGSRFTDLDSRSSDSRRQCVHYATEVARYLQDYRLKHGDGSSLLGIALHCIATAVTTLIASIAERGSDKRALELYSLKICVRTLSEMEKSYLVARRVRKITQLIIRVCHLEKEYQSSHDLPTPVSTDQHDCPDPQIDGGATMQDPSLTGSSMFAQAAMTSYSPFSFDELMPLSAQMDIFHTFDTEMETGQRAFSGAFG